MKIERPWAPGLLAAVFPLAALACGVCIEDKMAATYDHAVIEQALARGHVIVFTEVNGLEPGNDKLAKEIGGAAEAARGVDRGSARVSTEPAALSFALDPKMQTPQTVFASIGRKLAARGVTVDLIRVMDSTRSGSGNQATR